MTPRRKKLLKIIGYNMLVVLLLMSSIELGIRYYLNNPGSAPSWLFPALKRYYENTDRGIIQFIPECAHYSDDLFYELNPGEFQFANREFDNLYSVNSSGFRDDEASLEYPTIIALGDSYTMGWGVDQGETFPEILERELGKTVLNTGVSSYGTAREIHSLKKVNTDSLQYIVLQYCPNDFSENKQYLLAEDSLVTSTEERWNESVEHNANRTGYYPFKHLFSIIPLLKEKKAAPVVGHPWRKQRTIKVSQESAFLNVLKTTNFIPKNVHIILFSLEAEHCHGGFVNGVQKLLEKEHSSVLYDQISFIDLTGLITPEERFRMDPHLNRKGHAVVANKILEHIEELQLKSEKEYWHYPDGTLGYVCDYKNGVKHGTFTSYWDNGKVSRIGHFQEGLKHGEETNYTESGWMYERKMYVEDVLSGTHIMYDSLGRVIDSLHH